MADPDDVQATYAAANALHCQVDSMKDSIEGLLEKIKLVLNRSLAYGKNHRGAAEFLQSVVDATERRCDQECAKLMEGVDNLARDLDYAMLKDEEEMDTQLQNAFASRIGSSGEA